MKRLAPTLILLAITAGTAPAQCCDAGGCGLPAPREGTTYGSSRAGPRYPYTAAVVAAAFATAVAVRLVKDHYATTALRRRRPWEY